MKFKEGDRVMVIEFDDQKLIGKKGTIVVGEFTSEDTFDLVLDNDSLNTFYDEVYEGHTSENFFSTDQLKLLELPYTKITEKLMKGKINYIKDGIIYLK
jgi:hypothetical protein